MDQTVNHRLSVRTILIEGILGKGHVHDYQYNAIDYGVLSVQNISENNVNKQNQRTRDRDQALWLVL